MKCGQSPQATPFAPGGPHSPKRSATADRKANASAMRRNNSAPRRRREFNVEDIILVGGQHDWLTLWQDGKHQHLGRIMTRVAGDEVDRPRGLVETVAWLEVPQGFAFQLKVQLAR